MFSQSQILQAYNKAIKSRKNKLEWIMFNREIEKNLNEILNGLNNKSYIHWKYKKIILNDGKKRYIFSPHIRDHIIHHLLYENIYRLLDKKIPYNSFASRKWKWIHKWLEYFTKKLKVLNKKQDNLWYMKVDMSKYFYTIDHKELKKKLFKFIKNEDSRYLINLIIDGYKAPDIYDHLFPKDWNYNTTKNKWVPIWAITSQVFANFYLYDIDHHINHNLKPQIYLRYMDDLIFVDKLENLKKIKVDVLNKLNNNKLFIVYNRVKINKLSEGINLLGFRIKINDNKVSVQVSKNNKKKIWKLTDNLKKINFDSLNKSDLKRVQSVIESRKSHFKHSFKYDNYLKEYSLTANNLMDFLLFRSSMLKKVAKILTNKEKTIT